MTQKPDTFSADIRLTREGFTLDLRFALHTGITALIGRSGAGKSMLLDTLAGLP